MYSLLKYIEETRTFKSFKKNKSQKLYAENLDGPVFFSYALAAATETAKHGGNTFVLCGTEEMARLLYTNRALLSSSEGRELLGAGLSDTDVKYLPSSGRVMYSPFSGSSKDIEQLSCLSDILTGKGHLVITNIRAFCMALPEASALKKGLLTFKAGDEIDTIKTAKNLTEAGFFRTDNTSMPGEFTLRGEVLDIYPYGASCPYRIYVDWDKIEKICAFEALTQRITKELGHLDVQTSQTDDSVTLVPGGIREYITDKDYFIFAGDKRLESSYKSLQTEARSMYRNEYQKNKDALKPDEILFDYSAFHQERQGSLTILDLEDSSRGAEHFDADGPRSYFGNFKFLKEELEGLEHEGWSITIFATSALQRDRLQQMLKEFETIRYAVGVPSSGFSIPRYKTIVMCESELLGRRRQVVKTLEHTESSVLDSFVSLKEGDFVVHVNYGIGKFIKIDRVRQRDYIKIQFSDGENLYVPIEQANLVQRYIGSAGEAPRLDKLGSSSWENKKAKARKSAEKMAQELVTLYARRQNSRGYPFAKDNDWQLKFEAEFEFEETLDQLHCIQDIKDDMESPRVMDRLICGDVGFGKTEVAFRAVFKAVMSGRQVAFLAPTTILAEQHYSNFKTRLHSFPLETALLSRMVSAKRQKEVLSDLKSGKIDVLFGTHKIIQKSVEFCRLGLLVVDEEQRFGVKDKERIKMLRTNIDCLSLSATPIPRTLYMSLLKIRDMSLLQMAPVTRRPIKTFVERFDTEKVKQAIRTELERGGQVFYLHNRIEGLEETADMLRALVPEAMIETAHGQMNADALEDVMRRFVYQGVQVLVSTTIIENGIDIPNVNTIIIDRADMYGVSQLYQLRGRVGRSDKEAYAYLLYPSEFVLSEDSIKRLQIISQNTELGSGFKVAMKDMELRGAGNLLGKEQSGFMSIVGLDMYIRLLDEEIEKQKNKDFKPEEEVYLELDYSGFIPDSYISDGAVKFEIYKKISSSHTQEDLDKLTSELKDRFGALPDEVSNLLYISSLRIVCRRLEIYHMKERQGVVTVEFSHVASVAIDKLIDMIKTSNGAVSIDPKRPNIMNMKTDAISLRDKALFILEKLERLIP